MPTVFVFVVCGEDSIYNKCQYQTIASHQTQNVLLELRQASNPILKIRQAALEADRDALLLAAEKGDSPAVTTLLAPPHAVDPTLCLGLGLYTPLHHAANRGHLRVAQQLLDAGCSVSVRTKSLETPLHLAAYGGHLGVVEFLLDKGAGISNSTCVV